MKEIQLHEIWSKGRFRHTNLNTTTGKPIEIIDRGWYNTDSGPDFFSAKLKIGSTVWVGNVELHIRSSDWHRHGHNTDPAYDNTILHVVLNNDEPVYLRNGQWLECLELRQFIEQETIPWTADLGSLSGMPCRRFLEKSKNPGQPLMYVPGLMARLNELSARLNQYLRQFQGNWHAAMNVMLFRAMGLRVNAVPMEQLACAVPPNLLFRYAEDQFQLEALLFGQAGFLGAAVRDPYFQSLQSEYQYLRHKHNLTPIPVNGWKWLRMRPSAFPHVRIARLAAFLSGSVYWFTALREARNPAEISGLFGRGQISGYWKTHNHFGKSGAVHASEMPESLVNLLAMNTAVPYLAARSGQNVHHGSINLALSLLEAMPAENNKITRQMSALGFSNQNAAESQSLLGLKRHFCEKGRCLQCEVGLRIISG